MSHLNMLRLLEKWLQPMRGYIKIHKKQIYKQGNNEINGGSEK